ncbi:MAG: CRTAC1 family protein, partial [Pirellulaceae bacterium]|nr:CRTAC1 family protein [Pirellulaceae bacterium]
ADFDNDGDLDAYLVQGGELLKDQRPPNQLFVNRGDGYFTELPNAGGADDSGYGMGAATGDYDNDGNLDLFFTTVYGTASFGRKNNPVLFRSNGEFAVTNVSAAAGVAGLSPTYQSAWADFNNDGSLDLISGGQLFRNTVGEQAWIEIQLAGDGVKVNRSAIGAQVRIKVGEKIYTRQVEAGTGEGNQNQLRLHFGLGAHEGPVNIEITWPGSTAAAPRVQNVQGLAVKRLHTVKCSGAFADQE